jgi:hypothetical protein
MTMLLCGICRFADPQKQLKLFGSPQRCVNFPMRSIARQNDSPGEDEMVNRAIIQRF